MLKSLPKRRTLDVLPPLPLLLTAQCLGVMGSAAYSVSVMWWLKSEIGADWLLALAGALYALPTLLLGVWAGRLADRYDRKTILVLVPLTSAAVLGIVVALSSHAASTGATHWLVGPLLLAGVGLNTALTFEEPALLASFPDLTDEARLGQVNAAHQLLNSAGSIGGALLGGVLAGTGVQAGATLALFTALLGFLLVPLTRWPAPATKVATAQKVPSLREIWQHTTPELRQLLIMVSLFIVLAAPMPALLPALVHDLLKLGAAALGQLEAAFGAGFVLGGGLTLLGLRPHSLAALGSCVGVAGLIRLGLGNSATLATDMTLLIIGGAAVAMASIAAMTQLQEKAPAEARGTLLGAASTLMAGATPLGLGLATLLLPVIGLVGVLQATGLALVLLCGVMWWPGRR